MTVGEFAEAAYQYAMLTGASATSAFRTEARNRLVGGVTYSAHRFGRAVDVVYDTTPPREVRDILAQRLGLKLIDEGDHDHLQPLDWGAG